MDPAPDQDLAMVSANDDPVTPRDYTRSADVLITIQLRILKSEEEIDEPDPGLRPSVN